jgi:hypothetical protein
MIPRKIVLRDVYIGVGIFLVSMLVFYVGVAHGSSIKTLDLVEVYEAGKKDALRVSPRPSLELELTCANVWAGKVAPPEVLK